MEKLESKKVLGFIINSKWEKSSNFKCESFLTRFDKLYKEANLSLLFEKVIDNKNENDYDKDSFIAKYISFCDELTINENNINETKPN